MEAWRHQSHGRVEILIHFLITTGCSVMMCYSVYKVSQDINIWNEGGQKLHFFKGLSFLNRDKDRYNYSWFALLESFFNITWKWFLGHAILGQVLNRSGHHKKRKYFFTFFSMAFIINVIGIKASILYLSYLFLLMTISYLTSSLICIWSVAMALLISLSNTFINETLIEYFSLNEFVDHIVFEIRDIILAMGLLRSISTALYIRDCKVAKNKSRSINRLTKNKIDDDSHLEKKNDNDDDGDGNDKIDTNRCGINLADVFCYNLYFPLIIYGPFMPIKEFIEKLNQPPSDDEKENSLRMKRVEMRLFFAVVWGTAKEFFLHFSYHSTIAFHFKILSTVSRWASIGAVYLRTMMFVTKYYIVWSTTSAFALLDGIETVAPPSCGQLIYRYGDMWKSFDIGFYEFLKRHIYVPIGGSRGGSFRQFLSALSVFGFIFIWHGHKSSTMIWVLINMTAIVLDTLTVPVMTFLSQKYRLSPSCLRRIHSLLHVPIYFLSTGGSFLFMNGKEAMSVVSYRVFVEGFPESVLIMAICVYGTIEFAKDYKILKDSKSKEIKNKEINKDKNDKEN